MERKTLYKIAPNEYNKDYQSNVEYAIKLNRWLLKPIGIWPIRSSSKLSNIISFIYSGLCCFIMIFMVVPTCIEIFTGEQSLKSKLEIFGPTNFCAMAIIKYCVFAFRSRKLKVCIDFIIADWREVSNKEERVIMFRNVYIARSLTGVCVTFMFAGGIFYNILLPLLTSNSLSSGNVTIRMLPYRGNYILFDAYVGPFYHMVYLMHCLCAIIMYSVTTVVCSLATKFVMHTCGQCQIVISLLKNLIDGNQNCSRTLDDRLAVVVVRHLRVLRFASHVENILNELCLLEFVGCTINLCLLGYYFITEFENANTLGLITFFLLLVSFTFNIFIFCYVGELLTDHCHQIGEASYMIDWYRLSGRQGRFLIMIIAIANRPINLTAGKMIQWSLMCFTNDRIIF
ncbi:putative odorant receptor 85d isoform X2 [Cephus cinctus]|uniref:Odorant receptor n=1 Tax=Cephus cinctus TaxID=211228 RepID=A0AAJ7FFC1_CEPCN|nr:putative odorant receptor 85d isoform X2 [Cephus cinctus]